MEEKGKESGSGAKVEVSGASGDAKPNATTPEASPSRPGASEPGSRRKCRLSSESMLSTRSSPSLEKILGVDLVAQKLLPFLTLSELKVLSEVSWGTLSAVRKLSNFSNLARLHLSMEVLKNGLLKLGEGDNFIWKNVSLELSHGTAHQVMMDSVKKILEGVESLHIYEESLWWMGVDRSNVFPWLELVLKQSRNLKGLGLEAGILNREAHPEFFTNLEIQRVLGGLHELAILGVRCPHKFEGNYYSIGSEEKYERGEVPLHQNMLQISKVSLQLKKFSFNQRFGSTFEEKLEPAQFIKAIINSNRESLEEIELRHSILEQVEEIQIQCPNLKSLKLREDGGLVFAVDDFLMTQPPLEQLDIYLDGMCDFRFLQGLADSGKFGKLTLLHLDANRLYFLRNADIDLPPVDWQFLTWIVPLKDFALTAPFYKSASWDGVGEEILRSLPPTTEKISLRGISHFWRGEERNIGALLSRFHNLTQLDLFGCVNTVTDEGLQSLIVNCANLTSLAITRCYQLTDFGLTGVRVRNLRVKERTGVSLDQLKGLVHLKIRVCPRISRGGLLSVLRFQHLRTFLYNDVVWYPRWARGVLRWLTGLSRGYRYRDSGFLFRIARQNPSLETVGLRQYKFDLKYDDLYTLRAKLRRVNPRVKDLDLVTSSKINEDFF